LLFPADKFISPVEPTNIHDVQIVEEVLRETADKVGEAQILSNGDVHMETKLFPHLIPYGKGSSTISLSKMTCYQELLQALMTHTYSRNHCPLSFQLIMFFSIFISK
jgi:hypothetical protein